MEYVSIRRVSLYRRTLPHALDMQPVRETRKLVVGPDADDDLLPDEYTVRKLDDHVSVDHLTEVCQEFSHYGYPHIRTILRHIYEKHGKKFPVLPGGFVVPHIEKVRVINNAGVYELFQTIDARITQEMLEFYGVAYRPPQPPHYMDGLRDALHCINHVAPFYVDGYKYDACYTELNIVIVDRARISPGDHLEEKIANTGFTLEIVDAENAYRITALIMRRATWGGVRSISGPCPHFASPEF